ncbi:MAG: hypothetical protein MI742_00310, partial [Desulfobacterales bacterium]|nr:hypothetical protein [Desulfobacterales bacterium]
MNRRTMLLLMTILIFPSLLSADVFTSLGARWPAGLKKVITGSSSHIFSASGDLLVAYKNNDTINFCTQIEVDAPEGILGICRMDSSFIVAACGTGGLKIFDFDNGQNQFQLKASITTSSRIRSDATEKTAQLDIKTCTVFKVGAYTTMIAAADENYGLRIYKYDNSALDQKLSEVSALERSKDNGDLFVAVNTWTDSPNDRILTVSKNRKLKAYTVTTNAQGFTNPREEASASLALPDGTPSSPLYTFSAFALARSGNRICIVENTLGNLYLFDVNSNPNGTISFNQVYPATGEQSITFAYPVDIATSGGRLYVSTLVKHKNKTEPGIQVVDISNPADPELSATIKQEGVGPLYLDGGLLTSFDMKNGISKFNVSSSSVIKKIGVSRPTPLSIHDLLSFQDFIIATDGLDSAKGGFRSFDISNPTQPKRLCFVKTSGKATCAAVTDDIYRLFVADGGAGVQCYSMANELRPSTDENDSNDTIPSPKSPVHLQTIESSDLDDGKALKVAVTAKTIRGETCRFLHVLTDKANLISFPLPQDQVPNIDLSDKTIFSLSGEPKDILAFQKEYILVAAGSKGFQVIHLFSDDAETLKPGLKAQYTEGLTNTFIVTSDGSRYAFIVDKTAQIVSFDLFNNQNMPNTIHLKKLGRYAPANDKITVHYVDIYATTTKSLYAISDEKGYELQIINSADPSKMMEFYGQGTQSTAGTPMAIVAATTSKTTPNSPALRAAYVADGQGGMAVRQTTEADNNKEQ